MISAGAALMDGNPDLQRFEEFVAITERRRRTS
jgi:hypothetical protein